MSSFSELLAKTKVQGNIGNDGDFFLPDVRGRAVIMSITNVSELGQNYMVLAKVIECEAKIAGGVAHTSGSLVKQLYNATKYSWKLGDFKRDLCRIVGLDPTKDDSKSFEEQKKIFGEILDKPDSPMFGLKGVMVDFDTKSREDEEGNKLPTHPSLFFKHIAQDKGNSPKEIETRKKAL